MKMRLNCYFSPELLDELSKAATQRGVQKSVLVQAAVASFLSPDALDRREAAYVRRLDYQSRQIERLERDVTIAVESLALFVHHWLTVTPPLPASQQAAARAQGLKRYEGFIESLGRRLQQGKTLVREVSEEIFPESYKGTEERSPRQLDEEATDAGA